MTKKGSHEKVSLNSKTHKACCTSVILLDTTRPSFLYRVFSRDVTAAMLVSSTNPLGIELYFYANSFLFFCFKNRLIDHVSENTLYVFAFLHVIFCNLSKLFSSQMLYFSRQVQINLQAISISHPLTLQVCSPLGNYHLQAPYKE